MIFEVLIFLFLNETICCDPSSEPSRRDGIDEGHYICFCAEVTEIIPNYHQILKDLICIHITTNGVQCSISVTLPVYALYFGWIV